MTQLVGCSLAPSWHRAGYRVLQRAAFELFGDTSFFRACTAEGVQGKISNIFYTFKQIIKQGQNKQNP